MKNSEQEEELENDVPTKGCRAKNPSECPTHGTPREHKAKRETIDTYGESNEEQLIAHPNLNKDRAETVVKRMLDKKGGSVEKFAYREETGWIQLDWGVPGIKAKDEDGKTYTKGFGLSHILEKHPELVNKIAGIVAHGEITEIPDKDWRLKIRYNKYSIIADKSSKDGKYHIITCRP